MPRTARASEGGLVCHVLNRGNDRQTVFHHGDDYSAFLKLVGECALPEKQADSMRVPAACLMPNHFHLVLWPRGDGDLTESFALSAAAA